MSEIGKLLYVIPSFCVVLMFGFHVVNDQNEKDFKAAQQAGIYLECESNGHSYIVKDYEVICESSFFLGKYCTILDKERHVKYPNYNCSF